MKLHSGVRACSGRLVRSLLGRYFCCGFLSLWCRTVAIIFMTNLIFAIRANISDFRWLIGNLLGNLLGIWCLVSFRK